MLTLQLIAFLAYFPMQESLLLGHWPFKYFLILLVKQRLYVEQIKHIARLQMFLLTMSLLLFPSFSAIRQQILPCVDPGNHSYQRFFRVFLESQGMPYNIFVPPTCKKVAFEQGSHRKEKEHVDDAKAPAKPKQLPADFRRKRRAVQRSTPTYTREGCTVHS